MIATLYWVCLGLILFSLFGYGLLWTALAKVWPQRPQVPERPQQATMIIAARNEVADIGAKIASVLAQDLGPHEMRVLVVSDGSDDGTGDAALRAGQGDPRLTVIEMPTHGGKAAALNAGLARVAADQIVLFSDANARLRPGALCALLAPFGDPQVGGAIGQLDIPDQGGLMDRAERLFWRYDNAMKQAEDRIGGTVSAQGTLYAVRRPLVGHVPPDMADDLFISLGVVARGRRLAFAPRAVAEETITGKTKGEFGRRVRSTERGWRGLMHYARLMNPVVTGAYAPQLFFHKFLRRIVAFLLPVLLVANLALLGEGWFYAVSLVAQLVVYGGAIAALLGARFPGASAMVVFTVGHVAIAWAIVRWACGVRSTRWSPVRAD